METSYVESIFRSLWDLYGVSIENDIKTVDKFSNDDFIDEFFFVVLGGFGISYEINFSALKVLKNKGFFERDLYKSESDLGITVSKLKDEFNQRQFEPKTKDNQFRKFRFVETKPLVVASAGNWLWSECEWNLKDKIEQLDAISAREWLCDCPGFGMKTASWFLRNLGLSNNCAVLDVHLIRFLKQIGFSVPERINEKTYLHIEKILCDICEKIDITLGKFDYLLWMLGRSGYLAYVR